MMQPAAAKATARPQPVLMQEPQSTQTMVVNSVVEPIGLSIMQPVAQARLQPVGQTMMQPVLQTLVQPVPQTVVQPVAQPRVEYRDREVVVEKPVYIDREVERVVERPVETVVEKPVYIDRDRIVDRPIPYVPYETYFLGRQKREDREFPYHDPIFGCEWRLGRPDMIDKEIQAFPMEKATPLSRLSDSVDYAYQPISESAAVADLDRGSLDQMPRPYPGRAPGQYYSAPRVRRTEPGNTVRPDAGQKWPPVHPYQYSGYQSWAW